MCKLGTCLVIPRKCEQQSGLGHDQPLEFVEGFNSSVASSWLFVQYLIYHNYYLHCEEVTIISHQIEYNVHQILFLALKSLKISFHADVVCFSLFDFCQ